jgi:hypothetical protein
LDGLGIAFESHKPLLEFKAFYEALSMKFRNLKFPEFPEGPKYKSMDPNIRMKKFGEVFDQILLYAQQYQAEMSAQLMKMIYTFLMSKAKSIPIKGA